VNLWRRARPAMRVPSSFLLRFTHKREGTMSHWSLDNEELRQINACKWYSGTRSQLASPFHCGPRNYLGWV
jgi:hypothetical protein